MLIQCDSREHKTELKRIQGQFDELGVDYFTSKLYVGDYMNLDNPRLVIDRKKDLLELCGNVCQQHERFRAELVRAMDHDIRIIILVEHGEDITCLEDVFFWENPRTKPSQWVMKEGHPVKVPIQGGGIQGKQLFKSLCTIRDRYKVQFRFCTKDKTGAEIVRLLGGGKEWLRQRRDG